MRSAERAIRRAGIAIASAALAACATPSVRTADVPAPVPAKPPVEAPAPAASAASAASKALAPAASARVELPPVDPAVQRAFDAARQALAAGRTAEAERAFATLAKSHPELSGPHANLGLIHRQAGRHAEAVAALQKAVQLSPQRADLANQLGIAHRMAGEFDKAKRSYEQSIALDANYAPAVLNLGILYDLYLWDGERALELYDRYLQLAPGGDEQVKRWISDLRNRIGRKNAAPRKEQG
jgi:Flp pilus assembly protein TadD